MREGGRAGVMRPQTRKPGLLAGSSSGKQDGVPSQSAEGARQHTAIGLQDPGTHWPLQPQLQRTLLGPGDGAAPCFLGSLRQWDCAPSKGCCVDTAGLPVKPAQKAGQRDEKTVTSEDPAGEPGSSCA